MPIGGLFAAVDNALMTVSPARVDDLVKDGRPGARRLRDVLAARPKYVALTVLLRITARDRGHGALAAVFAMDKLGTAWGVVVAIAGMAVINYVVIGVGPRTLGAQHAYSIAVNSAAVAAGHRCAPDPADQTSDHCSVTPSRPVRDSATGRSRPRSSCVKWSTWPNSPVWSPQANAR